VDPQKIEAMKDWPCPKTIKILRGLLGLTEYYCKFVQNYRKIVAPLTVGEISIFGTLVQWELTD
jgi:hypothetical protein